MNFRYLLPLFIVAASSTFTVQAASSESDRWFDVELLVFKRNVDIHSISEQLDQKNVYLKQRERLEVLKATALTNCTADNLCVHQENPVQITENEISDSEHRLQLLDESHLHLMSEREKLAEHELFRPLIHVAFRMPIQNQKNALPIHLFAGRNYALDIHKDEIQALEVEAKQSQSPIDIDGIAQAATDNIAGATSLETNNIEKLDVLASLQKQKTLQDLYEIDGNLLIYVERYLYVDGQLIVRTETEEKVAKPTHSLISADEQDDSKIPAVEIVPQDTFIEPVITEKTVVTETLFDQKRRLRSEEIHYLDHPLFGIIVQIRKIPAEELAILNAESAAREKAEAELKSIAITQ